MKVFIDAENIEERYSEQLYLEFLEKQNEKLQNKIDKIKEYFDIYVPEELKYLYDKNNQFHKDKDYGDKDYACAIQSVQAIKDGILKIIEEKEEEERC